MAEVFQGISDVLSSAYTALISAVPATAQSFIKFFIIAILIVLYSLFVWKFYRTVSKKDIIGLNLSKYNKAKHPITVKFIASILFFIEYILIAPLAIFLWFAAFTILLILLSETSSLGLLLILSATTITAIRMVAYHNEDLSRDIAKLIPFTLLATSLLQPNFFSIERIIGHIKEIPGVFGNIFIYLFFIVFLELALRLLDFVITLFGFGDISAKSKKDED